MHTSRFLRTANFGLLIALVAAFALAVRPDTTVLGQSPTPSDDQVNRVAKQLYCPVCESTPLDVCPTEACRQWRELIRTMLAEGKSEAEIKQYFVEHYGPQVLNEPPNRLASYLVPTVVILLGTFLLFRGFKIWLKPAAATEAEPKKRKGQPAQDPYVAKLEEELKKRN